VKTFTRLLVPAGAVLGIGVLFGGAAAADNSQTASNTASSTQSVAAISGDASAEGWGSQASSGVSSAAAIGTQFQGVFQGLDTWNTSDTQDGANVADNAQEVAGASGYASAIDGGLTETGESAAVSDELQEQIVEQFSYSSDNTSEVAVDGEEPPADGEAAGDEEEVAGDEEEAAP